MSVAAMVMLVTASTGASAAAQALDPGPPGPWVADVRGVTLSIPQASGFYPPIASDTLVPSRGFGIQAGAHVYVGRLGGIRLGTGADLLQVRGTTPERIAMTVRTIAPQVSLNFGTAEGWSYVSGGVGVSHVRGRRGAVSETTSTTTRESTALLAFNIGGGARWFLTRHVGITFDLRLHRLGAQDARTDAPATPGSIHGSAAVGLALR
jgi:hypothetical protein